jgi:protease-4
MGSLAASGAYYIAVGSKKVYANPGTATGSIGVIMSMANLEKLYDWAKVKRYAIKTGKFKDAGAEYRDLLPEERAYFQGVVDSMLVQFKQAVATGRKLTTEQVDAVADGRVFSGTQAKELGLVDEIGTFQDAVKEAGKLAGIQGKPKLLYPRKKVNFFKVLSDMQQESEDESEAEESSSVVDRLVNRFSGQLAERLAGKVLGEALPQQSTRQPGFYMLWSL